MKSVYMHFVSFLHKQFKLAPSLREGAYVRAQMPPSGHVR